MPNTISIAGIYKKQEQAFLKHLQAAEDLTEQSIHKLRVSTKRLRTLFRFMEWLAPKQFKQQKQWKLIKPVFKSAGIIRSCTLNSRLLAGQRSRVVLDFMQQLKATKQHEESHFLQKLKRFDTHKLKALYKKSRALFKSLHTDAVLKQYKAYIKKLLKQVQQDLAGISDDAVLHNLRKQLKQVKILSGLLKDVIPQKQVNALHQQTTLLEEMIGRWHDALDLASALKRFMQERDLTAHDTRQLNKLLLQLQLESDRHKQQLAAQLYATQLH